jgi:hypothetical protein
LASGCLVETEVEGQLASPARSGGAASSVPYVCAALLAGGYLYLFVRILTSTIDEGTYLYGAQLVAHGGVPFRDFPDVSAGGEFYWVALFFKLLGVNFFAARLALWITGTGTAVLVFYLSRRIGGTGLLAGLFVLLTSIPMMVMNSPHYESNLFALAAVAVFLTAQACVRLRRYLFSGVLAGVATCFLQQKGVYLLLAFAVSVCLVDRSRRLKKIAACIFGFACVGIAGAAFYAHNGALASFVRFNLRVASEYHNFNAAPYGWEVWARWIPDLFASLQKFAPKPIAAAAAILINLPFLMILALPLLLPICLRCIGKPAWRREMAAACICAYALFLSEFHRHDIGHLRNGSVLLAIVLFSVCESSVRKWARWSVLAMGCCLVLNLALAGSFAAGYRTPLQTRRGIIFGAHRDRVLEFLLAHTTPDEGVFVYPYRPIYYFAAGVTDPTPFTTLVYHVANESEFREAVRDLDTQKVKYVLWDAMFSGAGLRSVFPAYQDPPPGQCIMEPYLKSHYRQIAYLDGFRVMQRK